MANRDALPVRKTKLPTPAWAYATFVLVLGVMVWVFWLIDYSRSG
jgi:hypothetical protein